MKRVFAVVLLCFLAFSANAQVNIGGQFSINFSNEHVSYFSGRTVDKEYAYLIDLRPKAYWYLSEKMQIGGRIGFAFGHMITGTIYDTQKQEDIDLVNRAVGWSVSPFFGYRLLNWSKISVWAEVNVFFGQYYNTEKNKAIYEGWGIQSEYGFQILPVVNINLTETLALQLHLGFISLGWYGNRAEYPDRVSNFSSWDIHKGGFAGLAQGLSDYGIGVVKKF